MRDEARTQYCREWDFIDDEINKRATKTTLWWKNRLARQGKAGLGYNWGTHNDELAPDCKHKENQ